MKKSDLPQDKSDLLNFTREVCYVKNDNGKYEAELSSGWDVKTDALNSAWLDIENTLSVGLILAAVIVADWLLVFAT